MQEASILEGKPVPALACVTTENTWCLEIAEG